MRPPADGAVTREKPGTRTGVSTAVLVPTPSWPVALRPHAQSWPSVRRASTWLPRQERAEMVPEMPATWAGRERELVVPSPSWP